LATPLGLIDDGQTAGLGSHGSNTVVAATDSDFVSIDGSSDTDFFSFSIDSAATVDITLMPRGAVYSQGAQGGSQSSFNTADDNNLSLALFGTNQTNLLTSNNSGGAGQQDAISGFSLSQAGEYYVRVAGASDSMQFYDLRVSVMEDMTVIDGDFDNDGDYDCDDIDALVVEIAGGMDGADFDLSGDGMVDGTDLTAWLSEAGEAILGPGQAFLPGDATLNGAVDGEDFIAWNAHKFTSTPSWCDGDFNADGVINGADFIIWNANKFSSADVSAVPEPVSMLWMIGLVSFATWRRR
jgi:hypothetical protein